MLRKKGILFILLLLVSIFFQSGFSQNLEVIKYKASDGLLTNIFNFHLLQDSKGSIWSSSIFGVVRYDGIEFKNYQVNSGLTDYFTLRSIEDPNGKLWVQIYNGDLVYLENDQFHSYQYNDTIRKLLNRDFVWHFQVDALENIYFGHKSSGIWKIDTAGNLTNLINHKNSDCGLGIWFSDHLPPIPFGIKSPGMKKFPDTITIFNHHFDPIQSISFPFKNQTAEYRPFMYELDSGNFVLSFGTYLLKISQKIGVTESFEEKNLINAVCEDQNGDLWIGTRRSGLTCFHQGMLNSPLTKIFFPTENINSILEDKEGGIWISVYKEGIWYIPNPKMMKYYVDSSDALINHFNDIVSGDRLIYFSSSTSLIEWKEGEYTKLNWTGKKRRSKKSFIGDIFWNRTYKKLFVAYDNHILTYQDGVFANLAFPKEISGSGIITNFLVNDDTAFYAITDNGLISIKNGNIVKDLPKTHGRYIYGTVTSDQGIFLVNNEGLYQYQNDSLSFLGDKHPMLGHKIRDICYHKGSLLISSPKFGLILYQGDSTHILTKTNDILNNFLPEQDTIWVNGIRTLYKIINFQTDSVKIERFLISSDPNFLLVKFIIFNNKFYFTSNTGLIEFERNKINAINVKPLINITSIKIHDKDTTLLPKYTLEYDQNIIQIDFAGITFRSPKTTYQYRMVGVDENWRYTKNRHIQYTKLTPATYTFEVYAKTYEGIESKIPARIVFEIKPPYWGTLWFRFLVGLALILIIVYFVKRRMNISAQKRVIEKQLYTLESKALRSQMNPHFIFNVLGAIQVYITNNDAESSEIYLTKFSKLIRLILENSRNSYTPFEKELEMIKYYMDMEKMRFNGQFNYHIQIEKGIDPEGLLIPSMLIQPYIENAIIHGFKTKTETGKLDLHFSLKQNDLECVITDNGIGFNNTGSAKNHIRKNDSLGMLITNERLGLLNKNSIEYIEIKNLSELDNGTTGTRVTLTIPIKKRFN